MLPDAQINSNKKGYCCITFAQDPKLRQKWIDENASICNDFVVARSMKNSNIL